MRRLSIYFAIALLCLASCTSSSTDEKPKLAVSIEPQKKILEELAGDNFDIITVLSQNSNPESFEPSFSQRMDVSKSKAYFTVGFLPFENTIAKDLNDAIIVNTSRNIELVRGTHTHNGKAEANEADPHTWTSLINGKQIAKNMLSTLIEIDPDNADLYNQRYAALTNRLDSLNDVVANRLKAANAHAFAIWHPSLNYFARDYGLHQIVIGQESKEISISSLKDIIDEAKEDSVKVFFFQKEYDSRQAQNVNNEIGSRLIPINSLAYDWESEILKIADELSRHAQPQ